MKYSVLARLKHSKKEIIRTVVVSSEEPTVEDSQCVLIARGSVFLRNYSEMHRDSAKSCVIGVPNPSGRMPKSRARMVVFKPS